MRKNYPVLSVISLVIALAISFNACQQASEGNESYSKIVFTDFEKADSLGAIIPATWKNLNTLVTDSAHSGTYASKIDSVHQFSALYEVALKDLDTNIPKEVRFSAYGAKLKPETTAIIVVSVSGDKYYKGVAIDTLFKNTGEWKPVSSSFKLPEGLKSEDIIKAYVWNKNNGEFLIDDYKLEFIY